MHELSTELYTNALFISLNYIVECISTYYHNCVNYQTWDGQISLGPVAYTITITHECLIIAIQLNFYVSYILWGLIIASP